MTTTRTLILTAFCVALFASPAFAMSTNDCEPKPAPTEPSLQDILDGLVVSGPPIEASSLSSFELFVAGSTGITAQIVLAADDLYFGIYDGDDPSNRAKLLKSDSPSSFIASVSFSDDGTITFSQVPGFGRGHGYGWHKRGNHGKHGGGGKLGSRSGFDGPFGFFAKVLEGRESVYIFTEDALNGGDERVLAFQGNGETVIKLPGMRAGIFRPDQFILAFDADGDGVFGDMVVAIAGVDVPVPEPASALLIGLSLVALLRLRRS